MVKPYIVGITGGSASGKTLFLNNLLNAFEPGQICLVSQDNYYKPCEQQPVDEQGVINFDTPGSILADEYARDIAALKKGHPVNRLEYTFNNPAKEPSLLTFTPAPVILVEGLFVFYFAEVARLIDLKIFIDAREHVKLKRRIARDKTERGYGLEDVLYRYEKHVAPTYEKYIEPYKTEADLIVPNNTRFNKALAVMVAFLKSRIHGQP